MYRDPTFGGTICLKGLSYFLPFSFSLSVCFSGALVFAQQTEGERQAYLCVRVQRSGLCTKKFRVCVYGCVFSPLCLQQVEGNHTFQTNVGGVQEINFQLHLPFHFWIFGQGAPSSTGETFCLQLCAIWTKITP